eukprot:gene29973-66563_t
MAALGAALDELTARVDARPSAAGAAARGDGPITAQPDARGVRGCAFPDALAARVAALEQREQREPALLAHRVGVIRQLAAAERAGTPATPMLLLRPGSPASPYRDRNVADPEEAHAAPKERVADPGEAHAAPKERVADPEEALAAPKERVADPEEARAAPKERVADLEEAHAAPKERVADPEEAHAAPKERVADPEE